MKRFVIPLALLLMPMPAQACSYVNNRHEHSYKEQIEGNGSIFLGRVIERTPTLVVFRVINSRSAHAAGDIVRITLPPRRYCDGQPEYRIGDIWLHDGTASTDDIAYPYSWDYGADNGADIEKLIETVSNRLAPLDPPPPPAPIIPQPAFTPGVYVNSENCPSHETTQNTDASYKLHVQPYSMSFRRQVVIITNRSCAVSNPCELYAEASSYAERKIIVMPLGQTACSLTLTQTAEGVTVQENDRAACAQALNCALPNGFNTTGYLQKAD